MTFYKRIDFSSSFIESVTTISFIFNSYRMKFYLERIEIVGRKFEMGGGGENENHGAETDFACYARRDKGCGQT